MKKPDIWMPLYIGDYLADTAHLTTEESGAYLHLLMHQWRTGSLPASQEALRRITRVPSDAWSIAWEVLAPFFTITPSGSPIQGRLERVREEWSERKLKATEKAENAARARWGKDASSIAQAIPMQCPLPTTTPLPTNKEQKPQRAKSADVQFSIPSWIDSEAWEGYLDVRRKKRAVMTERALTGIVKRLSEFKSAGHDPNEILATSMRSNWTDVYQPKPKFGAPAAPKIKFSDPDVMNGI